MRVSRPNRFPTLTWKEPRSFTTKYRRSPIFYGWAQFRIFLYLAAGTLGCWGLDKLNPKHSENSPGLIAGLGLSLFAGFFIAYGLPLVGRLAPSIVRLYPNYLVVGNGLSFLYFRFGAISGYKLVRELDGWILKFSDLDRHEDLVAISTDEIKMKVEMALVASNVPKHALSDLTIAKRKAAVAEFQEKVKAFGKADRKHDLYFIRWIFGFLIVIGIFGYIGVHYFPKNNSIAVAEIVILFAGIFGYGIIDTRLKRRSARMFGLSCPPLQKGFHWSDVSWNSCSHAYLSLLWNALL